MTSASTASETMFFEQFYLGCLAHASYLLASDGEAVVVDPQRDVEIYLQAVAGKGFRIRHIFETHLHADFVSGHKELAARTGAQIYIGAKARATFPHVALHDGFELRFGRAKITVFETPGHTPESICLLLTDEGKSAQPWAVLTGDTLFIGDVGRPDLSATHTPSELAGMLYDSLHNKLMTLPEDVVVYPAHGAGSLCGRNMRAERSSTIGAERLTNYAVKIPNREQFIRELTSNLPARPEYFLKDAQINREGAASLAQLPELPRLSPQAVHALIRDGVVALDVRPGEQFARAHVPGSINIALSGQFATWAGTVLGLTARPILIAETDDQIQEARVRLARVGIDAERGFLAGGICAWTQAGFKTDSLPQMTVEELCARQGTPVLDVRRKNEWTEGHIQGARHWPLDQFSSALPAVDKASIVAVHCKSGYRSMIACCLLRKNGYPSVSNVVGGFDAWIEAGYPITTGED
jgi:glyoxylase-like metal-dependent hydrolase (beta-lactamase superfamily II)/rhodanese-related sulfurtransferase